LQVSQFQQVTDLPFPVHDWRTILRPSAGFIKLDAHRCPVWIEGMLDGVHRRESLKVSSWEKAEKIRREMEEGKTVMDCSINGAALEFSASH
jgi:hypothetical protein